MKPEFSPRIRRYLRQVVRHLTLTREAKGRIRSDLSTTIAGKLEAGFSEDAILQELGDPRAVAAEFNAQMGGGSTKRSPWRFLPLLISFVSGVIFLGQVALQLLFRSFSGNLQLNGVIGGADGPTAIFVTTAPSNGFDWELWFWLALQIVSLACYLLLRRGKKKEE